VIGKSIGTGLREALARRKARVPKRIVLLNDTAATLLSGLSQIPAHANLRRGEDLHGVEAGPMAGLILGTGFNTAYPETRIPKIGFDSPGSPQIVVCETGNFFHRYAGVLDREYDQTTRTPGAYTLEKACSGAYLGPLTFHIMRRALSDGLFTFNRADEFLSRTAALQTKDLNAFMHEPLALSGPIRQLFGKDERDALSSFVYLTSIVTQRGGLLSAAVVGAAIEKAAAACQGVREYDPFVPVRAAVEGTTFMIYKGMRAALESYLHVMLNRKRPRAYAVAPVEQASLFGAAVAALSG
jgi:hexokinase